MASIDLNSSGSLKELTNISIEKTNNIGLTTDKANAVGLGQLHLYNSAEESKSLISNHSVVISKETDLVEHVAVDKLKIAESPPKSFELAGKLIDSLKGEIENLKALQQSNPKEFAIKLEAFMVKCQLVKQTREFEREAEVNNLEKEFKELNKNGIVEESKIHLAEQLTKQFGTEIITDKTLSFESINDLVIDFSVSKGFSREDSERELTLLHGHGAKNIVSRLIAGLTPSTVASVEQAWSELKALNPTETGVGKMTDTHWVAILPKTNESLYRSKKLSEKGAFKDVFATLLKSKEGELKTDFVLISDKHLVLEVKEGTVIIKHDPTFLKEAEALKLLQGKPGIIPIHTVTTVDGVTIIIMEKAGFEIGKGGYAVDLSTAVNLGIEFDEMFSAADYKTCLSMFKDALFGLKSVHDLGYAYRDFKLDNILCRSNGKGALADFGMLVKADYEEGNHVEGTALYLAPERFAPGQLFDCSDLRKADVWSVGVALWDAFSRSQTFQHPIFPPYEEMFETVIHPDGGKEIKERSDAAEKKFSHLVDQFAMNNDELYPMPENEESIARLIWDCLQFDPDKRPTIDEVISRLEKIEATFEQTMQEDLDNGVYARGYGDKLPEGSNG